MLKKINLQYLLSYMGLLPFIIIILDRFFLSYFNPNIIYEFIIFYSLIIFVFIGATNWNLKINISLRLILAGFLPSLISVLVILIYLNSYEVIWIIAILFILQLINDNFIYVEKLEKKIFNNLRVPLTLLIVLSLIVIQLMF
tara:strand:- start:12244 stop:12669 length:426 start_codon:yes stop_codon:yes gene_type:complete